MLEGILIKKAWGFNPALHQLEQLSGHVLPTQAERFAAPMAVGTAAGAAGGYFTGDGEDPGHRALVGGALGALGGGTYGAFRRWRVGRPTLKVDTKGNVNMFQLLGGGDPAKPMVNHAQLQYPAQYVTPTKNQWHSAFNQFRQGYA